MDIQKIKLSGFGRPDIEQKFFRPTHVPVDVTRFTGKTSLMNCMWYSLTGAWIGGKYWCDHLSKSKPEIRLNLDGNEVRSTFNRGEQLWEFDSNYPDKKDIMLIYRREDGGFSICDNSWMGEAHFKSGDIWWMHYLDRTGHYGRKRVLDGISSTVRLWSLDKDLDSRFNKVLHALCGKYVTSSATRLDVCRAEDVPLLDCGTPIELATGTVKNAIEIAYCIILLKTNNERVSKATGVNPSDLFVMIDNSKVYYEHVFNEIKIKNTKIWLSM